MPDSLSSPDAVRVALRKESVDRNRKVLYWSKEKMMSLSARRAWIEMTGATVIAAPRSKVALRKESVDRNHCITHSVNVMVGRSPQGERG